MLKTFQMKKWILLLTVLYAGTAFAQDEDPVATKPKPVEKKGFKKENIFLGGNLGVQFGSYTFVNVSPQVGYHFNKHFEAGAGVNLQYVSQKVYDQYGNDFYKESYYVFGGNLFARVFPVRPVFLQIQPEYNWINARLKYYNSSYPVQKYTAHAPSLLVGIGASFDGGLISIMYDVLQNPASPYSSKPFLSIGIGYGFDD